MEYAGKITANGSMITDTEKTLTVKAGGVRRREKLEVGNTHCSERLVFSP